MTDTLLWVAYVLSATAAFALVYYKDWPIAPAMIVGAAVTMIAWGVLVISASAEERPPFLTVDAALNGSFGLIFAAAGAAVAYAIGTSRS